MLALNTFFLCSLGKYFYDSATCKPAVRKSRVVSGHYDDLEPLNNISNYMSKKFDRKKKALHIWTEDLVKQTVYFDIETIRTSNTIIDKIKDIYPDSKIINIRETDEIYLAVSPKDAKNSDRSLVDCHYDSPLSLFNNGVSFYRIIIACDENDTVTTTFPNDDIRVKMTTGDFHGLDYNKDYHCVEGSIPENKKRVLLKLHYLVVPNKFGDGSISEMLTKNVNIKWTKYSRYSMNVSAEPKTILDEIIGTTVDISRKIFNKL
jgi:hypothetical protein